MQDSLKILYSWILPRFKEYLKEQEAMGNTLCHLEKALFKKNIPDYENRVYAMLYLMRYSAAYLSEYYMSFKKILETDFLGQAPLSILTLGAGSNIDGLAACIAIKDSGQKRGLIYQGIEKGTWPFTLNVGARFRRIQKNISECDSSDLIPRRKINLVSFPKILSEIDAELVINFLNNGVADYLDSRICFLFSNRNAENKTEREAEILKARQIIAFLQNYKNYALKEELHFSGNDKEYKEVPLEQLPQLPFHVSPVNWEVIKICADPGQFCVNTKACRLRLPYFEYCSEHPTTECREKRGRHPIKKASYFDTHIFFMEKMA